MVLADDVVLLPGFSNFVQKSIFSKLDSVDFVNLAVVRAWGEPDYVSPNGMAIKRVSGSMLWPAWSMGRHSADAIVKSPNLLVSGYLVRTATLPMLLKGFGLARDFRPECSIDQVLARIQYALASSGQYRSFNIEADERTMLAHCAVGPNEKMLFQERYPARHRACLEHHQEIYGGGSRSHDRRRRLSDEDHRGALFFMCVLLINAEAFVANRLVNVLCAEEGFLVPEFHQHRLFFTKVDGHVCDMCHNSSQNMYRCDVCDFDSCPACFNKKDKCTSEGIMRGDKGVRDVLDVGRFEYLMRGVRLIRPHLLLFLFALACLMGQSIASLVVPHFQGQIFDRIIEAHHVCTDDPSSPDCHHEQAGFYTLMLYFIGLSIGMGCLQALRALSFQIVARRIGIWVRTRLFNTMMRQDIAFFDGMRTGDLQNRLSEDISTMVQPIYTTLSTVLSNLMILVGGVTMCFLTSWRLSMLAFTTILPMMHITGVYAECWNMINTAIQALNDMVNSFTRAAGAAERVLSLYDLTPDIDPDGGAHVDLAVTKWSIAFEDVHFHYQMRPEQKVLQGMSFVVEEGRVCALVGRSGGGKSTVVHLMLRFYDPRSGRITLGGKDLKELNIASVHKHVGVVSQETMLFNSSIGENIAYGIEGEVTNEQIVAAAKAAQAYKFISEFEDGLSTRVGERGQRLSGGQKQRIAIARCLLRQPRLLLLDEATSALDAESEAQVQKALDGLIWTGSHTVILVAHRLSTVINSHQIVVVDGGRVAESGTHTALLAQGGTYATLVAHQVAKQRENLNADGASSNAQSTPDGTGAFYERQLPT
ncbi:ATP-binding cassette superfamily [Chrysochromulina tobinii]|uniref:ATP-binding cassette superfamily n=1 Tax=Chrysochromulina tobinii TaxID=1460289 RepID=A0A0M0JW17_9EUKA|nr:ATP-binding cassette superfamily [Chrysochromulina tobinii]|eukprot:KOO30462.1 ATP-binding cassette superfamily [Chrysochromulina sp. CCMP291]